ncbi:MAG: DUF255 domain-containing protein [Bacteroidota bacterium]
MKKFMQLFGCLYLLCAISAPSLSPSVDGAPQAVEWLSWSEAIERMQTSPRKILVDVYTGWCGYCRKMDNEVFTDALVAAYIRDNFYAVKLDAEENVPLVYDNHTFRWLPNQGRGGVHELAYALLDGSLRYPSLVYLDENQRRINISPGFKPAQNMYKELQYIGGNHYKVMTYEEYKSR